MDKINKKAKRMDDVTRRRSSKNPVVHLLVPNRKMEMFGRKPKQYTACKRKIDINTVVSSDHAFVTCKRCLKKINR